MFLMAAVLVMGSCGNDEWISKNSGGSDSGGGSTEKPQKTTIMVYGVGGATLDRLLLRSFVEMIPYGATDEVNVVYEYKLSEDFQIDGDYSNADGIMRWDLKYQDKSKYSTPTNKSVSELLNMLKGIHYGEGDEDNICCKDSLKQFINDAAKIYPADRYVLILCDHGGGWRVNEDGLYNATGSTEMSPKGIVYDDNDGKNGNSWYMTTTMIRDAIKASNVKKVDALITYACNMGQWEVLSDWKDCAKYVVASQEVLNGLTLSNLLQLYKNASLSHEEILHKYCDEVMTWREDTELDPYLWYAYVNDLGCYDMTQVSTMEGIIKEITTFMKNKESVNIEDEDNPDYTVREIFEQAVTEAIVASAGYVVFGPSQQEIDAFEKFEPYLTKEYGVTDYKYGDYYSVRGDFIRAFQDTHQDLFKQLDVNDIVFDVLERKACTSLSFADYMKCVSKCLENEGQTELKTQWDALYNKYMTALKQMAYITMTHEETGDPYVQCSPSITGYSFNADGWNKTGDNRSPMGTYDRETMLKYYKASTFDKQTGWSEWLQLNRINPNVLSNDSRMEIYYRKNK